MTQNIQHPTHGHLSDISSLEEQNIRLKTEVSRLQALYDKLFENLAEEVHLWEVSRNEQGDFTAWTLIDVNPTALQKWNKTKEEVIGKTPNEIFGVDAIQQFKPIVEKLFETGEPHEWLEHFPPTDQYLKMKSVPLGDYFISTGNDISEQLKKEKALKDSEQKYRNIAENLPGMVLIYQLNADGTDHLHYVSKGVEKLYGISQKEALQNNHLLWERVHPEDLKGYQQSIQRSAETLTPWKFEHRLLMPDGTTKWLYMSGVPTLQKDHSIIWDSFGLDITDRIVAENELEILNNTLEQRVQQRTKEILKVSKELELYRLAAEHANSGVWHFDLLQNQLHWDDTMFRLYGITRENFSGAYEAWETSLHPEDKERAILELEAAINGEKPFDTVFRIIHPESGEIGHIRAKGKVERDKEGKALKVYGTNWDVTREMKLATERKKALENLKATQSQLILSEKMASMGVMTAGIAHEINNPLNYILGGYQAIMDYLASTDSIEKEELLQYLEWIKVGGDRAASIVKSLNLISRNNESQNERCDLHEILEGCLIVMKSKHKGTVEIRSEWKAQQAIVAGNNGKLHQVFLNLISNAIDAIKEKGLIELRTLDTEDGVEVQILDNGIGISPEHKSRIMDPFFTTKPPGKGTGLGLSISKSIVEEHGGSIRFESRPKETIFYIRLPNRMIS
jgi:PAS domain S-box-containing protein